MKKYYLVFIALLCTVLVACSPNLSSNTLSANEVGTASKAVPGTIIGKRVINIDNTSGIGGLAGAGAGAAAGSTIGGGTAANILGGIGGALVGGAIGYGIDKSIHSQTGFEYIIRLNNNKIVSVTQARDTNFGVGQRVLVIFGPRARLIPTNG
ncbi:MAG TPA: hypothetical protein VHE99_00210 [Gammaproteobacteria bacterium]|nr:hypothetical protein [Gammaproteobacteria bacterium]